MTSMKNIYFDTVLPDSQRLMDALRAARWDDAAGLLHRLKGVMLTLGADDALAMIAAVEAHMFDDTGLTGTEKLHALMASDAFLQRHFVADALVTRR